MNLSRKRFLGGLAGAAALAFAPVASAQTTTLRFHQMLPPQATIPAKAIKPWAEKVEKESGGRIKVQLFPTMQLGGKPPELFDQAKGGVVDLIWTVLGYTPGRFPKSEVFELPFSSGSAEASSKAFWEYVEKNAMDEYKDIKLIAVHTHGPGLFHSKDPITKLEDLKGRKGRGGPRFVSHKYLGLAGRPFTARTFAAHPEGRLAATGLDRLPLLWPVLTGHMSLVGPRPIHNHTRERYGRWLASLASVKPGVTGPWAVVPVSGLEEEMRAALYYIRNWTIWLDVQVLAQTVLVTLRRRWGHLE